MSEEEKNKRIKEQFDRHVLDSKVATVGRIRDLLLSDEFIDALAKRMRDRRQQVLPQRNSPRCKNQR